MEKRHWCPNGELIFTYNSTPNYTFSLHRRNTEIHERSGHTRMRLRVPCTGYKRIILHSRHKTENNFNFHFHYTPQAQNTQEIILGRQTETLIKTKTPLQKTTLLETLTKCCKFMFDFIQTTENGKFSSGRVQLSWNKGGYSILCFQLGWI